MLNVISMEIKRIPKIIEILLHRKQCFEAFFAGGKTFSYIIQLGKNTKKLNDVTLLEKELFLMKIASS